MSFERMLEKHHQPTDKEILDTIGDTMFWQKLRDFLESSYDFTPELVNYGKHGWTIRYRKSGKTLCSLFPEQGAFTALIVLGKKETEKVLPIIDQLNSNIQKLIGDTQQLHDGRWLWIRVRNQTDIESIKEILKLKRKPKRT